MSLPRFVCFVFGGVLLFRTLVGAVPSALEGLAAGFGMVPGVSLPLWPPNVCFRAPPVLGVVGKFWWGLLVGVGVNSAGYRDVTPHQWCYRCE